MQSNNLITLLLSIGIAVNVNAAPPTKPPPGPQDVRVINTTAESVPVTVQNPTSTVTVDNGLANPVPVSGSVTVDNTSPIPVSVQDQSNCSSASQFVGFTTNTFTGAEGVVTYTNACHDDYPGSWMCSSEEFLNSKTYPASSGTAWIKPTHVSVGMGTGFSNAYVAVQDISGIVASTAEPPYGLSCNGWSSADSTVNFNPTGLAVDGDGRYSRRICSNIF